MKRVIMAVVALLVIVSGLALSTAVTHTKAAATSCGDPRDEIFCSSWVGSQLYVYDQDGGPPIDNSTINSEAGDLGLNVVRYEMLTAPCAIDGNATGCTSTTDVNDAINGIQNGDLSATPLIVLPPVVDAGAGGVDQCDGGNWAWDGNGSPGSTAILQWDEWLVTRATDDGAFLFEVGNEPDNYCGYSMPGVGNSATPTSTQCNTASFVASSYENLWDCTVPALRAYARTNDLGEAYFGGPGWTSWDDSTASGGKLGQIEGFITHEVDEASLNSNDDDYIPDFVSVHTYLQSTAGGSDDYDYTCSGSPSVCVNNMATSGNLSDAESAAGSEITTWTDGFNDLQSWLNSTYSTKSIGGESLNDYIKMVDSEYNDTIYVSDTVNTSQTKSQNWCNWYYDHMFDMFNGTSVWGSVQFEIASSSETGLNLINTSSPYSENHCYSSLQNQT